LEELKAKVEFEESVGDEKEETMVCD